MTFPSNSDGVAQDQIRAFVERILRMKEEAKAINDDIREIYAEAKGYGFDKTVLGKVVNYVEKRAKDSGAVAEADAIFDLYLEAYDGTPSRPHAHEALSSEAQIRADRSAWPDRQHEPADPDPSGVAADSGGGSSSPASSATQSTAALKEVPGTLPVIETHPRTSAQGDGYTHKDSERPLDTEDGSLQSQVAGAIADTQVPPVDTSIRKLKMNPEFFNAPHPSCQRPSFCGGNSNLALCDDCKARAALPTPMQRAA
jgi:uncharacterized protein (UPF0335 family)